MSRNHPLPEAPADAATSTRALVSFAPVRNLLGYSAAVNAGVLLQATALGKQIYDITGRELDIGLLGLAEFLPAALLVLVTGSVADRFNRRIVASLAVTGEFACSIALALYAMSSPTAVWPLFVIAVLFGASRVRGAVDSFDASDGRARWCGAAHDRPVLGHLDRSRDRRTGHERNPVRHRSIGRVLVGGFAHAPRVWQLTRIRFLRQPPPPAPGDKVSLHSALEGLRFIKRTPILLAAISLDLFAVLFGGAVALLPAIAEERLGVGDVAYGWLRAAPGIGAALMAVFWLPVQ